MSTTIRGAVLEHAPATRPYASSRALSVVELDLEGPGAGELLVRIESAGICHSDLSVINGNRPRPMPMLLGHEAAGRVEEVGKGVSDLLIGRRVVMTFLPRCGECAGCHTDGKTPCDNGTKANGAGTLLSGHRRLSWRGTEVHHHLGVSAFATHTVVSERSVVVVDDDIPPDVAALLGCAVLTGGGAVLNVARPEPGAEVAVVGLGGVGLAALLVAASQRPQRLIAVDSLPGKRERALQLGAHEAYSPQDAVTCGLKVPHVIEAAGHPRAFETALQITSPGGITVTVGLPAPDQLAEVSPLLLTAEARTIVGSYLGSSVPARDIPIYAELWRSGRLPIEELVSAHVPLEDINHAMDELESGAALRQIITFEGHTS